MSNLQSASITAVQLDPFGIGVVDVYPNGGPLNVLASIAHLQETPGTPAQTLETARLLFAFARFEAALILLADLVDSPAADLLRRGCYLCLARWSIETDDLARAEWASEQLLRADEGSYQSLATRGEVASLRNDDVTALEFLNRAIVALPREYAATSEELLEADHLAYLRVATLVRLRRYEEAFEQWRSAAQRSNANADLWYLGAFCLIQLGRAKEAAPLLERALLVDPHHIDAGKLKRHLGRERT